MQTIASQQVSHLLILLIYINIKKVKKSVEIELGTLSKR